MAFEIEIENINEIREVFRFYPKLADREIRRGLYKAGKLILRVEKRETPVGVTAQLRGSIGMRLTAGSVMITPKKKYAIDVHEGTKPHYVPIKGKRAPLRIWAIKHGINPYALQKAIARKGTKANPFVNRTVRQTREKVMKIFVQVLENILREI